MELHNNARSCPASRALLVRRMLDGMPASRAAEAAGVSRRTAFKWKRRFREGGEAALLDRSSRPILVARQTHPARVEQVLRLRRRRDTGPQIARRLGLSTATVARILARHGLSRLQSLQPKEPVIRYQRDRPGELLHVDIKKLGRIGRVGHRIHGDRTTRVRGIGWEFVHVAIDDASRLAYVEVLPNERSPSSTAFLRRSVAWFQSRGVHVEAVMSDNGSCYVSRKFEATCQKLHLRHLRTRPYRPRTNGKAERFIQTLLREWAYKRPYSTSAQRTDRLPRYLGYYNLRRPHAALNKRTPAQRL
ncbi:MAG TPA: IS481 family transposase, partial [Thermoanaerobaculia bacterium]|nr:IS481 family transposase [Thermoanaerobaculia bacterium]